MIFYDKVTAPSTGTLFNFGGHSNVSTELAARTQVRPAKRVRLIWPTLR